jgi:hypothetical protein
MSHWIASVISYSPRHDGSSVSAASRIESSNRYTPTSARSLTYDVGFSTEAHHPVAVEHRDAEPLRLRHLRQEDLGIGSRPFELLDEPSEPSSSTLSPRYIRNGWPATKSRAVRTACARPSGRSCGM